MKKLLIGLVLIILIVVGLMFFVFQNLDSLITKAVNSKGSEVLKADVHLNETKIDLSSGKGSMHGLKIGNPAGFKTPSLLELNEISLQIDKDSIMSDPVIIKDITIIAPQVTYETGDPDSNIDAIQKNVDAYLAQYGVGGGSSEPSSSNEKGKKIIIENFVLKDGKVNVSAALLQGKSMTVPLPDIHLKDIGKEKKGASPGEVAKQIVSSIKSSVMKAVAPLGLDKVGEAVADVVGGAKDAIQEGVGKVGDILKGGQSDVDGAVNDATSQVEAGKEAMEKSVEETKSVVSSGKEALEDGAEQIGDALGGLFGDK